MLKFQQEMQGFAEEPDGAGGADGVVVAKVGIEAKPWYVGAPHRPLHEGLCELNAGVAVLFNTDVRSILMVWWRFKRYHGDVERVVAERRLLGNPVGTFLVRISSDKSGTLCFKASC